MERIRGISVETMKKRVIVIGGGPSGMLAAAVAAKNGCDVCLLEKNDMLGKKLLITGKGRCNVTNYCDADNVINNINSKNPKFMFAPLNAFSCYDTYALFEQLGVPLKVERGNRVFPVSDRSNDIRNALKKYITELGVKVIFEKAVSVTASPFKVMTDKKEYLADSVIIATGGVSYPLTGSTGDGYKFAAEFSHNIIAPKPSLVALVGQRELCSCLAGLSLKNVSVKIMNKRGKEKYSAFGEMLFTHNGVSGPIILTASARLDFSDGPYILYIDLKPALSEDVLDKRILNDFTKYSNKDFINSLSELLPRKIIPKIVELSGIDPRTKVNVVTKAQRKQLIHSIKNFAVELYSKAGFDEAVITAGGVDVSQIDPKTMESKLVKGLYFVGEVLDVDANTGGYNLQIAFSTGYLAGISCAGGKNGF